MWNIYYEDVGKEGVQILPSNISIIWNKVTSSISEASSDNDVSGNPDSELLEKEENEKVRFHWWMLRLYYSWAVEMIMIMPMTDTIWVENT